MINLNDQYAISFNELSVDVYERKINQKSGEEYAIPKFYYANIEQALEGIIDRSLAGNLQSLKALSDKIKALKLEIREFLGKISNK